MSRFDIGDIISSRVMRSAASPLHGVLREESTRHDAAVLRSRATPSSPSHCETGPHHYLCFPQHNTLDAAVDRRQTVALLGGGAFLAKFFAEQCLRRGIGVTALARDPTSAAAALAPALRAGARDGPQVPPNGPQVPPNGPQVPPNGPHSPVDIVAGDVACAESVRRAVRGASLVVFLASAHRSAWPPWRAGALRSVDVGGLQNAIDACRLVDAHLLVLVPRRAMGSSLFSSLWPPLWARAGERQEQCLLDDAGAAVAGDVRFTILRVDGAVYPCHNERAVVAKNNRVDDAVAAVHIPHGVVDARMLATIALRAVALSRASVGSRIDVAGQRRHGADLRQIDALLHGLRSE